MFVRTTRVEKDGKTYQYAQLVESYRREDGKPRQRVIASLGRLTELEVENLKVALQAAKAGEQVVRPDEEQDAAFVGLSRDYLSIAVVLQMAQRMGLSSLLSKLLDDSRSSVAISTMVLALVAQRLVAPGSKLAAVRWFERTAVPELLGVKARELNNSRVHRALDALDKVRPQLQLGLAELYRESTVAGGAIFLDVSDTWFEGHGPKAAQRHKTKEGMYKKKIGIVLAVDKRGQPLRWEVVAGRQHDSRTMQGMAGQLRHIDWASELPLVFDRAMGKPKCLQELSEAGIRFVTLMSRESIAPYAQDDLEIPKLLEIEARDPDCAQAQAAAIATVKDAGFTSLGRRLWAKDLGIRRHGTQRKADSKSKSTTPRRRPHGRFAHEMALAEELTAVKEATGLRYSDAAASMGISSGKAKHLRVLMKLDPAIRKSVRDGECNLATLDQLEKLARLPTDESRAAYESVRINRDAVPQSQDESTEITDTHVFKGPELRMILAFDPVAFTSARAKALRRDAEIRSSAQQGWAEIALGAKSPAAVEKQLRKLLERYALRDCYEVIATPETLDVVRCETTWARKRRTDGMRLFAVHPQLDLTPAHVLDLYSAKMAVEVDFHVIKSVVQLRPVHHNTDQKVRAHVDLCVLALAIERALNEALPEKVSAAMALELLETVRLVDVSSSTRAKPRRVLSAISTQQRALLKALQMEDLMDLDIA